jgi:beta-glucosidase
MPRSLFAALTLSLLISPAWSQPAAPAPAEPAKTASPKAAVPSTINPVPRDAGWRERHTKIVETVRQGGHKVVFLGDSITEGWSAAGKAAWEKTWAPMHAVNAGIGGDRTQHVLWRLNNGLGEALAASNNDIQLVVLMIGTNNSNGADNTSEDIAQGIKAIVANVREKLPKAKVLMLGIFPRGEKPNAQREKNAKASEIASKVADGTTVKYLDIGSKFLDKDGTITKEIMPDFLHLSEKGYQIWAESVEPVVREMTK